MAVNQPLQRLLQERQSHSIAKAAKRWRYDPKGQTVTVSERRAAKMREKYERQALNGKASRPQDYLTFGR